MFERASDPLSIRKTNKKESDPLSLRRHRAASSSPPLCAAFSSTAPPAPPRTIGPDSQAAAPGAGSPRRRPYAYSKSSAPVPTPSAQRASPGGFLISEGTRISAGPVGVPVVLHGRARHLALAIQLAAIGDRA
jgi:hypothetical protein